MMLKRCALVVASGLTFVACSQELAIDNAPTDRVFDRTDWRERTLIGGSLQDTLLRYAGPMVADARGLFVADVYAGRIVHVDGEGDVQWVVGRRGGGPEEFARVVDLKVGSTGDLWVLDADNVRLSILDSLGSFRHSIPLPNLPGRPTGILPMLDQAWLVLGVNESPLVRIDLDGTILETRPVPWDSASHLPPLAASLTTGADAIGGTLYMAYYLGNSLMSFNGTDHTGTRELFIESVPFPVVVESQRGNTVTREFDGRPTFAARSVSYWDGAIHVHFAGTSEHRLSVIDVYDGKELKYQRSYLLPRRVNKAVVHGNAVYGEFSDPYPTVVKYTRIEEAL